MNPVVISLGELLVEVMRKGVDQPLSKPADFVGPFPSGAPAIFIDAAARLLGGSTGFIGVVGADDFGECVVNRLVEDGVDTRGIRTAPGLTTGIAFVSYRSDGSRKFVFHLAQSAAAQLAPEDVRPELFAGIKFLHVTGSGLSFSEGSRQACYRAIELCKQRGGRVSFDPNIRPELLGLDRLRQICEPVLQAADVIFPSGAEACILTGAATPEVACQALVKRGVPVVALKQGEQGSTVYTLSQQISAPPLAVVEVDPTGAGDCYDAGFVTGLLEGWDLALVARFANIVGALSVTRQGPMEGAPFRKDVLAYL